MYQIIFLFIQIATLFISKKLLLELELFRNYFMYLFNNLFFKIIFFYSPRKFM